MDCCKIYNQKKNWEVTKVVVCTKCKSTCYKYRCKIKHCSSRGDMHSIVESIQFSRAINYELSSFCSFYCSVGASLSSSALSIFSLSTGCSFSYRHLFLVKQNRSLTLQQVSDTPNESIGICQLMSSLYTIQEQRLLLSFQFL